MKEASTMFNHSVLFPRFCILAVGGLLSSFAWAAAGDPAEASALETSEAEEAQPLLACVAAPPLVGVAFFVGAAGFADTVTGTPGDDLLAGGNCDDTLSGANGDDVINGGPGDDTVNGGGADDMLQGGAGNDTINGSVGADFLIGGPGEDTMDGGNDLSSDTLVACDGQVDVVDGGPGVDLCIVDQGLDLVTNCEVIVDCP
jgi:Ca2+-binding RTX toxin-like protein